MSGTSLAEHAQDAAAQPSTTASEDNAASLRAAALMTLKAKKRKPAVVKIETKPTRSFAAPPSIELDYGQEEGTSSIASSPVIPPATAAPPVPSTAEPMNIDEGAAREEGEISDSEMVNSTPQPKLEPQSPVLHKTRPIVPPKQSESPQRAPSPVAHANPAAPLLLPHESFVSAPIPALVDENHARPGLAMTQAQYEAAKDIVLDLLGWGVPPEYLVSCGLSREIVYYVFVELNLRLPSNLDTTGLPPLPVPNSLSSSYPGPPSTSVSRSSVPHPSLPPKPHPRRDSVDAGFSHALSAEAPPFVPAASEAATPTATSSSGPSLHDMEQQRRQELLARKAVLASRKPKKKTSSATSTSHVDDESSVKDVPVVPTKMVDDFLQSIEPVTPVVPNGKANGTAHAPSLPARPRSIYDMDIDDVPGLTTGAGLITEYTPLARPPPPTSGPVPGPTSHRPPAVLASAVSSVSDHHPPRPPPSMSPTLALHASPLSYGGDDDDMDAIPGLFQSRNLPDDDKPSSSRRGTKRPVAADFVDMEPGPSKAAKVNPEFFRAANRRKTAGFAGLTQRRCVIDLSDSEADDNELARTGPPKRADSRASKAVTPQATAAPTPRNHSPAVVPAVVPSVLQEKEEAIRKMRELIAQREESRKKKLAAHPRSTPSSSSTPTNGVVTIKQEDDESTGLRSLEPSRSTSSSTPDRTSNSRPYDSQDERSVLDTLLPHETNQNGTISLPRSTSTSSATTPIDVTSRTMEHSTTGDKVLTDEARHEQVVQEVQEGREQSQLTDVDVIGHHPETSTQVELGTENTDSHQDPSQLQAPTFASYRSLLDYHPLLRERSWQEPAVKSAPDSSRGGSSSTIPPPSIDLGALKQSAVLKYLSSGSGRICQYEVPGGGECRDKDCEDVHLSRVSGVEPSDEDTAQYLCSAVPVGPRYGVKAFRDALDVARLRHPTMPFDERVQEALTSLGLR